MKTNPENYKWGFFYFNPKDKRVILPKANPFFGWTVNFGNWQTYLLIVLLILILYLTSQF